MSDSTPETTTPATVTPETTQVETPENDAPAAPVTYGGVNDRPDDVNHPDNLAAAASSTDPAAAFNGFTYDPETDTYVRSSN